MSSTPAPMESAPAVAVSAAAVAAPVSPSVNIRPPSDKDEKSPVSPVKAATAAVPPLPVAVPKKRTDDTDTEYDSDFYGSDSDAPSSSSSSDSDKDADEVIEPEPPVEVSEEQNRAQNEAFDKSPQGTRDRLVSVCDYQSNFEFKATNRLHERIVGAEFGLKALVQPSSGYHQTLATRVNLAQSNDYAEYKATRAACSKVLLCMFSKANHECVANKKMCDQCKGLYLLPPMAPEPKPMQEGALVVPKNECPFRAHVLSLDDEDLSAPCLPCASLISLYRARQAALAVLMDTSIEKEKRHETAKEMLKADAKLLADVLGQIAIARRAAQAAATKKADARRARELLRNTPITREDIEFGAATSPYPCCQTHGPTSKVTPAGSCTRCNDASPPVRTIWVCGHVVKGSLLPSASAACSQCDIRLAKAMASAKNVKTRLSEITELRKSKTSAELRASYLERRSKMLKARLAKLDKTYEVDMAALSNKLAEAEKARSEAKFNASRDRKSADVQRRADEEKLAADMEDLERKVALHRKNLKAAEDALDELKHYGLMKVEVKQEKAYAKADDAEEHEDQKVAKVKSAIEKLRTYRLRLDSDAKDTAAEALRVLEEDHPVEFELMQGEVRVMQQCVERIQKVLGKRKSEQGKAAPSSASDKPAAIVATSAGLPAVASLSPSASSDVSTPPSAKKFKALDGSASPVAAVVVVSDAPLCSAP